MSNKLNLSRLLESIEKNVLRDITWERQESDLERLLNRYEQLKKFGSPLVCSYCLNGLQVQTLNDIQKAITREASIRLFECSISIGIKIA